MSARDQGLEVQIVDGRLSITIGIDALMVAVRGGYASNAFESVDDGGDGYQIESVDGFASDICTALLDEEEDGTTLVHIAIDTAIDRALDAGSLNINYGDDA